MGFLKKVFGKKEENQANAYDAFWAWFAKNERRFFDIVEKEENIEEDLFTPLSAKLKDIKDGYYYLVGMLDKNTVELILTTDGTIANIVFVEELVKAAPSINGWAFTALKPPLAIENVEIDMDGYKFYQDNIRFYSNDDANRPDNIEITIVHDDYSEENKSIITNGTYIFLDNFLGELNFAETIDNLIVTGKENAKKELIPIHKLKDYVLWREKEFIEKYEGIRYDTENDSYSILNAELASGNRLLAVVNLELLEWDCKASHPWILTVEIKYDNKTDEGLPDDKSFALLNKIEDEISDQLKDFEGYLYIGRETANGVREVYFACKDFRNPSKIAQEIKHKYSNSVQINYTIYKDKYWKSFDRFKPGM